MAGALLGGAPEREAEGDLQRHEKARNRGAVVRAWYGARGGRSGSGSKPSDRAA